MVECEPGFVDYHEQAGACKTRSALKRGHPLQGSPQPLRVQAAQEGPQNSRPDPQEIPRAWRYASVHRSAAADHLLETTCMKGLVLTHMGRREEGIDLVKQGMRLDLTSHICWHVFGLIQKGEKNYEEALKSYTQALKFDRVSFQRLALLSQSVQYSTS